MYKELVSTNKLGIVIDTQNMLIGIEFSRLIDDGNDFGNLLRIGFLCFVLYIACPKEVIQNDR